MAEPKIEVLPRRPRVSLREELRASQRGRLICAIADAVAEQGYPATSVADVISRAGVSRTAFYHHFSDKEACFLAAYDSGADAIQQALTSAGDGLDDWEELLAAVLGTWLEFLQADPAFTRAYLIEFWAAGDAARVRWMQRRDRLVRLISILHTRVRDRNPATSPISDTLIACVFGGLNHAVISHILSGGPGPLTDLGPELTRFVKLVVAAGTAT